MLRPECLEPEPLRSGIRFDGYHLIMQARTGQVGKLRLSDLVELAFQLLSWHNDTS